MPPHPAAAPVPATTRSVRFRFGLAAILLGLQGAAAAYLVWLRIQAGFDGFPATVYPAPFYHLLATMDWTGAVVGVMALAIACALPRQAWVGRLADWLGRRPGLVASTAALTLACLAVTAHQAYPFTSDEYAPVFQSSVFAAGRLAGQWPPELVRLLLPQDCFLVASRVTGQCCSEYAPGHALLLTPFTALGIPWACNPVLGSCWILLLAGVAQAAFGRAAVGWTILFAVTSPVFMAYGMSFYAMLAHGTLNLLYARLLLAPTLPRVAAAGLVGGFALALHNPFPHTIFALPWLVRLGANPRRLLHLAVIGACYGAVFLPLDTGWQSIKEAVRRDERVGETARRGPAPPAADGARAPQALPAAADPRAFAADILGRLRGSLAILELPGWKHFLWLRSASFLRLMAWDAPALVGLACIGAWRAWRLGAVRLFALSALTTFLAYGFIFMSGGHGWGYRYFFSAWACLPLLAGSLAGPAAAEPDPLADRSPDQDRSPDRAGFSVWILHRLGLAAVIAAAVMLPVRCFEIHAFISAHRRQLPPLPAGPAGSTAVACIDPYAGYFRTDLVRNDPFLRTGPFLFVSQGPAADRHNVAVFAGSRRLAHRQTHESVLGTAWLLFPPP